MRMQSGITDQYIYIVAVDSTDYVTRETGKVAGDWTVYRSRNGGAATAYTTPTITEVDSGNMPGVYKFLLDEDMTIDSGDDSQEICYHITASGVAPITRTIELYRAIITAGKTAVVDASGLIDANMVKAGPTGAGTAQTARDLGSLILRSGTAQAGAASTMTLDASASAVDSFYLFCSMNIVGGTGAGQSRLITAYTGSTKVATTNFAWSTNPDNTSLFTITPAPAHVAGMVSNIITASVLAANSITSSELDTTALTAIAAGVWDRLTSGLTTSGSAGKLLVDNLDTTISSRASQTSVNTIDDFIDSEIGTIITNIATIDGIVDDILLDTAEIGTAGAGLTNINLPNQTMDIIGNITGNLSGSVGSVTGLTASNLDATISSRATPAQVNTEVVDALNVDTYAKPTGVPAATTTLAAKINHMYMRDRNRQTITATKRTIYGDDDAPEYEHDLADDGTTYDESEANAL